MFPMYANPTMQENQVGLSVWQRMQHTHSTGGRLSTTAKDDLLHKLMDEFPFLTVDELKEIILNVSRVPTSPAKFSTAALAC